MEKKIKNFLKGYRRIIFLGVILASITGICLYFLVPSPYLQYSSSQELSNQQTDMVINAFNGEGSVVCVLNTDKVKGEVFIKNGQVRLTEEDGEYGNVLFDGNVAYVWKTGEKEGMQVDLQKNPIAKSFVNESQIKKQIEENNPDCSAKEINQEFFSVPQDIVFTELDLNIGNVLNRGR